MCAARPRSAYAGVLGPWLIVGLLLWAGFSPTVAPRPRDAATPATDFSALRAMEHIREIAREPHPIGSGEIERVRSYLVEELEALGLELDLQRFTAPDYFGGAGVVDLVNVIAWIPGTANSKAVVFVSHYDTMTTTPGANDNSAAVATLLETARALQADQPLRNDIVFLFTDGEEPNPRYGANAFAALPDVMDSIGIAVNLEANGGSGASLLVETNGPESWIIEEFAAAAPAPAAFSFLTEISRLIGEIGTDFDVFKKANVPGMHFAYLRGSPIYHTPADNISSVNEGSVQHHGAHTLAIARHFGGLDLSSPPEGDGAIFFTIGSLLVSYPAVWAPALGVLALATFAWAVSIPPRPRPVTLRSLLSATGSSAVAILATTVLGTAIWMILCQVRSTPGVLESYLYFALILVAVVLIGRRIVSRGGRDGASLRQGQVALWVLLALTTAVTLPGFSYAFTWPALAAALALLWERPEAGEIQRWFRFLVVAALTLLLVTPVIDSTFLFAQPRPGNPDSELTFVFALPLLVALLSTALIAAVWPNRHRPVAEAAARDLPSSQQAG